ncbi:MAG TPA: UDP-N-acetylmuramate--L-alanine ligase [Desulfobacteraceae bacterium]|nr:UDP-N-acetylmuramate--L-alanine ligase [Desulfobacteraceae bacterium]
MTRFGKVRHIHLVGVGGIGMSGIAELLINLGYRVSGSDLKASRVTKALAAKGGEISIGHKREHVADADVVVYSSAVRPDNVELLEAAERAVPVIPRAEMLAELMRLKYGIAVAGAHGKTTTTSMVASVLNCAGLDPTVVIGGRLDIWGGSNAKLGQGEILVAEADESDGSFMVLSPTIAVVTNIDREHMDHYGSMGRIRETFIDFINKIPFYGTAILCLDNEEIQRIIPGLRKKFLTYGMSSQADLQAKNISGDRSGSSFEVVHRGTSLGRVKAGIPGEHHVLNALAATGVGLALDLGMDVIGRGLTDLGGLARRFQVKGEKAGVLVLDDYGHHPTEIAAVLKTARQCWPDRRLVSVFQPHRYSRTVDLYDRFVVSFNEADILIVAPLYAAGEKPVENVDSQSLANGIKEHGHRHVLVAADNDELLSILTGLVRAGDLVLTLGAGDIHRLGERLLKEIERRSGA